MEKRKKLKKCVSPLTGYMEDAYPLTVAITKESSYECGTPNQQNAHAEEKIIINSILRFGFR